MPCCHDYIYKAVCRNCGEDAIEALEARIAGLDSAARAAVGYLVNGQRADAEKALRDATAPAPEKQDTQAPSNTEEPEKR